MAEESQRVPGQNARRDFTRFQDVQFVGKNGRVSIVGQGSWIKILCDSSLQGLLRMKSQLLEHPVIVRLSHVFVRRLCVCLFATGLKKGEIRG